ncbi:MAG: FecR domain-containing protein, partial [Opitutales bacterium]|nr:FecR domain-containing protein [Opitutales bacterium]
MRSKFSFFRFSLALQFLCLLAIGLSHTAMAKVSATIILASVEGEVKALSLDEDLELTLDESFVGKSVDENFILTTGKNGKAVFLFSNGVLVTLKPNTRLYIRTFVQESFSSKNLPLPGELEEEPSTSHLKIHLDTGDLVVKAPKLKRGSSLKLTSPLGTAGIRGTMFQIVVARDPDTGTVSGGVNLISGDIDFTDVSGNTSILASGQGLEVSTGKLGDSSGGVSGELRDLSAKFGPALAGTGAFPPIVAPTDTETLPPEGVVAPEAPAPTVGYLPRNNGWGSIHDIATATFFEIEEAEFSVSSVTFDAIESAVSVDTPTPMLTAPTVPAAISGGDMAPPDPFFGGAPKLALKGKATLEWEMG